MNGVKNGYVTDDMSQRNNAVHAAQQTYEGRQISNSPSQQNKSMDAQRGEGGWNNGFKFNGILNQLGVITYMLYRLYILV
jgi:hypothetical protein